MIKIFFRLLCLEIGINDIIVVVAAIVIGRAIAAKAAVVSTIGLAVCLLLPTFALRADAADQDASKQTASAENGSAGTAFVENGSAGTASVENGSLGTASADNAYAESAENPVVTKHTAENEPAEEDKKGLFKFDLF